MTLQEFSDRETFISTVAGKVAHLARNAVLANKQCFISLAGGKTPKPLYGRLNEMDLPWDSITWIIGDERWVLPNDEKSNEKMIRNSLGVNRPEFNRTLWSWHGETTRLGDAKRAAEGYEKRLLQTIGPRPTLDLVILGLGADGHTASLFPDTPVLEERTKFFSEVEVPDQGMRVTATYPLLNNAKQIWFLAEGMGKAEMIQRLVKRDQTIPAARIRAANQITFWMK